MSKTLQVIGLFVFLILCLGVGALGGMATAPEIAGWYATLNKPSWNPPAWIFGPVWTTLYLMMAASAWLIWRQGGMQKNRLQLSVFACQLLLNLAWSWIFFSMHQIGGAAAEIVVLWVSILLTAILFAKKSKLAAALLLPYLCWVSFATILNFTLWKLNQPHVYG
jgi:benzodiazapine receptor